MVGPSFSLPADLNDPVRSVTAFMVHQAERSASVEVVARQMIELGCGALPVHMPDGRWGIITERDIVMAVSLETTDLSAAAIASMPVLTIEADATVDDAAEMMVTGEVRHILVTDGDRIGVVSMRDIVESLLVAAHP